MNGKTTGLLEEESLLVEQILSGEKELFRLLIQRYQQKVHAMGLSFFRNREDAADFTQDVYFRTYRSLASFKGHSRFSTWLYRIAYNTAVNNINRRKEYRSLAEDPLTEDGPEEQTLRIAATKAVRSAVEELPEKYGVIGFDCAGNPLEVVYNLIDDNSIYVFHAMKARNNFIKMIGL
jgi:RNA polymerase sigma-70 factor (ECF subfamily)